MVLTINILYNFLFEVKNYFGLLFSTNLCQNIELIYIENDAFALETTF
jgi:hypothetical protein